MVRNASRMSNASRKRGIVTHPAWRLLWVVVFSFLAVVYAYESWSYLTDLNDESLGGVMFGVAAVGASYVAYRMAQLYLNSARRGPGNKD